MSTMPKAAFLPKNVERGLRRWHVDAQRRLKLKVLEKYQAERLARRREGADVTPLDERYFLKGSNNDSTSVLAITDAIHSGRSTPMTLIMEEGSLHTQRYLQLPPPAAQSQTYTQHIHCTPKTKTKKTKKKQKQKSNKILSFNISGSFNISDEL
jgi:hypothetical protein